MHLSSGRCLSLDGCRALGSGMRPSRRRPCRTTNDRARRRTARKAAAEQTTEQLAAVELVRLAQEQGLSLTGHDGLLKATDQDGP